MIPEECQPQSQEGEHQQLRHGLGQTAAAGWTDAQTGEGVETLRARTRSLGLLWGWPRPTRLGAQLTSPALLGDCANLVGVSAERGRIGRSEETESGGKGEPGFEERSLCANKVLIL